MFDDPAAYRSFHPAAELQETGVQWANLKRKPCTGPLSSFLELFIVGSLELDQVLRFSCEATTKQ